MRTNSGGTRARSLNCTIPPKLIKPIKRRAAELGLSRSAYLQGLIRQDLRELSIAVPGGDGPLDAAGGLHLGYGRRAKPGKRSRWSGSSGQSRWDCSPTWRFQSRRQGACYGDRRNRHPSDALKKGEVAKACVTHGVLPGPVLDVTERIKRIFTVRDGKPATRASDD